MQKRYVLEPGNVLKEYPRPQMVRSSYFNLNGFWDFALSRETTLPDFYPHRILVPFSAETELSSLQKQIKANEVMTYRRYIPYTKTKENSHVLLHFGAVDHQCTVFLNKTKVGTHRGGYLPFYFDITPFLNERINDQELIVQVIDPGDTEPIIRGKQSSKPKGIFYSGQSGIYQTVWMEEVAQHYIKNLIITSDLPQRCWYVTVLSEGEDQEVTISYLDGRKQVRGRSGQRLCCQVTDVIPWSPEDPYLYYFTVSMGEDEIESYIGIRSVSVEGGKLLLNGKPYFHHGVLDQGYWPHSLYTPVSDQAMSDDIKLIKKLGFNMVRKHAKVENLRWYHHCDTLGLLVWQDMVSGGRKPVQPVMSAPLLVSNITIKDRYYHLLGSQDEQYRKDYVDELTQMIKTLYNCPSIVMWVLFNEGWGQFDAEKQLALVRSLDSTRTIDPTSGWYDQKIGDFSSQHVYFKSYKYKPDTLGRAVILSEFGGYVHRVDDHDDLDGKVFGYKTLKTRQAFNEAFFDLYAKQIHPAKMRGLAASVYTQFSDVEQELNGLVTFDRLSLKLDESVALQVAALLLMTKESNDIDATEMVGKKQNRQRPKSNQTKIEEA